MDRTVLEADDALRVMTLNLWHNDVEIPARLSAAAQEVAARSPVVLCLQEVLFRPDGSDTASELAALTGLHVVALLPVYDLPQGSRSGLAILSLLPALLPPSTLALPGADQNGVARAALFATLSAPSGRPLLVATTHLAWGSLAEGVRLRQVMALDAHAALLVEDLPDALCVLAGDLNTRPESDSVGFLRGLRVVDGRTAFWVDVWDAVGDGSGATHSPGNPYSDVTARGAGISDPSMLPDRRIDYVFVRGYAYGRPGSPVQARVAFCFPAASDHWGVEADLWDPPL